MRLAVYLFFPKLYKPIHLNQATNIEPEQKESYLLLARFLRGMFAYTPVAIFSSDNSLLAARTYGRDIYDLIETTKTVANKLLLDERLDHEQIYQSRRETFIREIFIGKDGSFPDYLEGLASLRIQAIRLAEGLELRQSHPELGLHTFQNVSTAIMVLKDLDAFFLEIFHDYRIQRFPDGNRNSIRGS